ncbi:RNA polymerase subunit sigma-70 [Flagellimonas lutaonensis]|uniref:RNA polymerase subunit sigma-70 n=2 Tax=Flagellimonas lutaonensis TaxID=516051 RepID=A0A0D5YQQ9_9FLAO|nr:RNA polymerase subunit sigma-70 [Allomuricauda lutaonensis]
MQKTMRQEKGKAFHERVAAAFADLKRLKAEGNDKAFNERLLEILPAVKNYLGSRLNNALRKGIIPRGKYRADDFLDELFLEVFEHFDEVSDKSDLHPWLFKKADALFEDKLVEEEFDAVFFENIHKYSQLEWQAMEEEFSTDGDGDLVMLEELDDISYKRHDYLLKNIFLEDDKKDLMAKLDHQFDKDAIARHVDLVLNRMPEHMQTVFQLHIEQRFGAGEIALIKSLAVAEVEQLLSEARQRLEKSLYYRYLIDNT